MSSTKAAVALLRETINKVNIAAVKRPAIIWFLPASITDRKGLCPARQIMMMDKTAVAEQRQKRYCHASASSTALKVKGPKLKDSPQIRTTIDPWNRLSTGDITFILSRSVSVKADFRTTQSK